MDSYYRSMKSRGFSENTVKSVRKTFTCPQCGFVFSLVYARSFACRGCPESIAGCPKVRCAKCDHEFYIDKMPEVKNAQQGRSLQDHISKVMTDYYDEQGWKKNR